MSKQLLDWRKKTLDSVSPSFCAAKWLNATIHLGHGLTHSCHLPLPHAIDKEAIKKYVERWVDIKATPSESVFDNNKFFSEHYPEWYYKTFKPKMDDFNRFLQQNPLCERPDFWDWYVNIYLRESFDPLL